MPTLYIVAVDAAAEDKVVIVADVPCAYLHASREGLPKVYVRLGKEMTAAEGWDFGRRSAEGSIWSR